MLFATVSTFTQIEMRLFDMEILLLENCLLNFTEKANIVWSIIPRISAGTEHNALKRLTMAM